MSNRLSHGSLCCIPTIYAIQWTNKQTSLLKYISHTLFSKGPTACGKLRNRGRDISQREDFFPYLLPEAWRCQHLHPLASLSETSLIGCVSHARLRFSVLCPNLTTWFSSRYTPVRPKGPDVPSSSCLLIKMGELAKAHRVTRNELKIHAICYITTGGLLNAK